MAYSPVIETSLNAVEATGAGAAIGCGYTERATVQVVISGTATVKIEATVDGTNWVAIGVYDKADYSVVDASTGITSSGLYMFDISGIQQIRANCTARSSGTITARFGLQEVPS